MFVKTHPIVLPDLRDEIHELRQDDWQPFGPGVAARWLYNEGHGGASAVLLRYEPGARVAEHKHVGYEHQFVLEGDLFDKNGLYLAGSLVIHPPGSGHSPGSVLGCVALLIYEKTAQFQAGAEASAS